MPEKLIGVFFKRNSGFILRLPIFGKVPRDHLFDDELSWEVPEADHHGDHTTPMVHRAKGLGDTPI